jgi:hypothetical protein
MQLAILASFLGVLPAGRSTAWTASGGVARGLSEGTPGGGCKTRNQVSPRRPFREPGALQVACPYERHPVSHDEARLGAQVDIPRSTDKETQVIEIGRHHPSAVACIELIEDDSNTFRFANGVKHHWPDADRRQIKHRLGCRSG